MSRRTAAPVREDAHDVGAPPHLLVEALLGIVRPDLRPMRHGERGEGEDLWPRLFQHHGGLGEAFVEHAHHAAVLCVDLLWRGAAGRSSRPWPMVTT